MENDNRNNIQGEALPIDELLDFAIVDSEDLEYASEWFDEHALPEWVGVLDQLPSED